MSSNLSIEVFNDQIRYLSLRFGKIEVATQAAYYEFLQNIPEIRFRQVCKTVFCEWDKGYLPAPQHFLNIAAEIAEREGLGQKSLPSDLDLMPESERLANLKRISEMVKNLAESKPMPVPTAKKRLAEKPIGIEQIRQWFHDPATRKIALAEAMGRSDIKIITDTEGNAIDLQAIEVAEVRQWN